LQNTPIPIVIIGFRNASDVTECLSALARARRDPAFSIHICENGGRASYDALIRALSAPTGPCAGPVVAAPDAGTAFETACRLKLAGDIDVTIGLAHDNLGYAGGINACIEPLLRQPGWEGLWVLNPDTAPEPDALAELLAHARKFNKGMVGSRIMTPSEPDQVGSRGLRWNLWQARTIGVDKHASAAVEPDRLDIEARIDSPHGASFYVTRGCIDRIGLMEEGYFLYFEDLEWGLRAKAACGVGYAFRSVVPHLGGTTIGSGSGRKNRSELAVYLDYRNRLLFVRRNYPGWLPWSMLVDLAWSLEFVAIRSMRNFKAALAGWAAGVRGETGRPDALMKRLFGGA
jgi:N-acetylglucosaminyl-diphospho-decaprenol L-rhamnosyltransferase